MKILFLLTQDLESPLGIGRVWPLAKELSRHGNQVKIAALHSRWNELAERRLEVEGVVIEYVGPMHVRKVGNQKLYYSSLELIGISLRASWALTRSALAEKVDIIQVWKPHPMNSIAGLVARWLRGGILCVDCDDYEARSNRFGAGWQQKVVAYSECHVPRLAQVVTTHTQFMWDKLVAWGCPAQRIHFLPNGVDRARFAPPSPEAVDALRQKLGLEGKKVVAYLGTLSLANHPVDLLLKAFAILHNQMPATVLLMVGGGDDYERLMGMTYQTGIQQAVCFTGRVPPNELPFYYALVDVTVDPVNNDDAARGRLPLKMFESWAMGVPFVTADVGERLKMAGLPPASLLAKVPGDARALAEAIQNVLVSADMAQDLRQRGLERVKDFCWDILAERLEAIYKEASAKSYD